MHTTLFRESESKVLAFFLFNVPVSSSYIKRFSIAPYDTSFAINVHASLRKEISEPRHEKTNVLVSDLVRHKPGCTATEEGYRLEISDLESRGIVLSM